MATTSKTPPQNHYQHQRNKHLGRQISCILFVLCVKECSSAVRRGNSEQTPARESTTTTTTINNKTHKNPTHKTTKYKKPTENSTFEIYMR